MVSNTEIVATVPAGLGATDVTVATPEGGTSTIVPVDHFTFAPGPAIDGISPARGGKGTKVTITGSRFTGATSVEFGTAAATFSVTSDTSITATAPAPPNKTSLVDITVTTLSGTSPTVLADQFTYPRISVTGVRPANGPPAACSAVQIVGYGFTGATSVSFGSTPAQSFVVTSDTTIRALSPSEPAGTFDVTVTSPQGTSAIKTNDEYTYVDPLPQLLPPDALVPAGGPDAGGTAVRINGAGFSGVTSVVFGSTPAQFRVVDDAEIAAISPPGTGTVDVTVVGPGGTSQITKNDRYVYGPNVATVTGVSPSTGVGSGGTEVTISGTGFLETKLVTFGGSGQGKAKFTIVSDTQIKAVAPPGAGTADVQVTDYGVPSSPSPADRFTWLAAPLVAAVSPASGLTAGGTTVTISGSGFSGTTQVLFGNTQATFTIDSDSEITATSPGGSGVVDIVVTSSGGTSYGSGSDLFSYD